MKIAIVGPGMIGSAAARHLAKAGHDVVLIGTGEPDDWGAHHGAFASHYDEGRITRVGDPHPFYARVSKASIDRYGEIEAESGISFFTECGALIAGNAPFMDRVTATRAEVPSTYATLDADGLRGRFPYLSIADGVTGHHEPGKAGHISPRRLVAAQQKAAAAAGAKRLETEAVHVAPGLIKTDKDTVACDQVIVAAGGWTDAVLGRAPELKVYARTVAFHEIPADEVSRLATMPSMILNDRFVYVLPPIRYPDGRVWLKLGGETVDRVVSGRDEIGDWFRSGGDGTVGDALTETLTALIPDLAYSDRRIAPCVTTFTENGLPEIRKLEDGLTVAAAGCGAGAKCSDELGRMAAEQAIGDMP
ncbi:MAG: FAD-dependent oxidoreductase [Pseudomonadota bacterium]